MPISQATLLLLLGEMNVLVGDVAKAQIEITRLLSKRTNQANRAAALDHLDDLAVRAEQARKNAVAIIVADPDAEPITSPEAQLGLPFDV